LPFSRLTWLGPSENSKRPTSPSATEPPCGRVGQRRHVGAQPVGQQHDDGEAPIALEEQPRVAAANSSADHVLHVGEIEAAARNLALVDADLQERQPAHLLNFYVAGTLDIAQHAGNLVGGAQHRPEIFAEHLDREVLTDAGDQLVEAHLDRLREADLVARQLRGLCLDTRDQLVLGEAAIAPFLARLQNDVGVGGAGRHRIGGEVRCAGAREYEGDFGELGYQPLIIKLHGL
jgi:hypothetical protein